jgi:zinc protease
MAKRLFALAGLLLMFIATNSGATPKAEAAQQTQQADSHVVKLENGLTVLVKQDKRFPLVNIRLYVHAGSAYEDPGQAGISHQLEHMVFKGTDKRAPGQTALDIESVGGSLNAATSFDYTVYYVEVPDDQWQLGMDVVSDMAFNAKIDPDELASERKVVLAELERGEDTPSSRLFKTIQGMIWKGTSYEWPIIGYRDTIKSLTSKKIHDYINTFYQPQSMLLTIVGNVDVDKAIAEAKRLLGPKRNTRDIIPTKPFALPQVHGPAVKVVEGKWNKVYLGAAFPIPDLKAAQNAGLEMLAQLLCGDETSYLYRKFKYEKRLVDNIGMSPMSLERSGFMYIHATLDADKVQEFWKELMQEMAAFTPSVFSDREIERARLNLEDSLFLSKETLSGLAAKLGFFQLFEDGEQSEQNYLFALNHVDRKEMGQLFSRYIRPDQLATAILAPENSGIKEDKLSGQTKAIWKTEKRAEQESDTDTGISKTVSLPNGSKLILMPDTTLPYTALSMYWAGGEGDVPASKQGLASLSASVLTRGTASMNATEIEDFLSDHAASIGASAGRTTFALEAKYPSRFSGKVLPLLKEMALSPSWDKEEVDRARQDQIASIKRREDQPLGLMFRHLFPFLFADAPYSYLSDGTPASVAAITAADARKFWEKQRTRPFTMAVVGDFDAKNIEDFAKAVATAHSDASNNYAFPKLRWNTAREKDMSLPERNQAHIVMSFPVPGKSDLETSAQLAVLKAALAGQSGLLFRDMRDKQGLGYTVTSFLWQAREGGLMALYIGTSPDKVDQALKGFKTVLKELELNPLPQKELDRAKSILKGEYYQEHQSLLSRSREAALLTTLDFDTDHERMLIEKAQSVTPQQIQKLARTYLNADKAYLMKVLP